MGDILLAAGVLGGLALFFGTVLAAASRFLKVEEDPRIDATEELLPGTNCGACGQPGCRAFAEALVTGRVQPSGCTVSSPDQMDAVAAYLGVSAGAAAKRVARLHCAGGAAQAVSLANYSGETTCAAAAVVSGGGKACSWGCLGLDDCARACTFDAITMNADRLPVVDVDKCTACNDCVVACPRNLFEILPLAQPVLVQCKAPLAGEMAHAVCDVACDACGKCALDAPAGRIIMRDNLPVVDYSGPPLGPEVTARCPTRAIRWVPRGQFEEDSRA